MRILPDYHEQTVSEHHVELQLTITEDIEYLKGHFNDHPILPGVVQTQWAIHFAKLYWNITVECQTLKQIKFKELIMPNHTVTLLLDYKPDKNQLHFKYLALQSKAVLSSGIIEKVLSHS